MDRDLAEKILRHGTHTSSCRWRGGHDCDCGWEELQNEAKKKVNKIKDEDS